MKTIALYAMAFGLMSVTAPAGAAVLIDPISPDGATVTTIAVAKDFRQLGTRAETRTGGRPRQAFGETLAAYASLLPMPSQWLLLLTGFCVIGYAMRSRKRVHVNFS